MATTAHPAAITLPRPFILLQNGMIENAPLREMFDLPLFQTTACAHESSDLLI